MEMLRSIPGEGLLIIGPRHLVCLVDMSFFETGYCCDLPEMLILPNAGTPCTYT